jgi:hypothetical protein
VDIFAVVELVAVISVAVAAMEIALSGQQDADARGCSGPMQLIVINCY